MGYYEVNSPNKQVYWLLASLAVQQSGQVRPGRLEITPGPARRLPPCFASSPCLVGVIKSGEEVLVS